MEQLATRPKFREVAESIHFANLTKLVSFKQDWNEELILQFYATLFIHGDPSAETTWVLTWLTGHHQYNCTYEVFLEGLDLGLEFDSDKVKLHDRL